MADPAPPRPKPRRARGLMDRRGPGLALERHLIARIARIDGCILSRMTGSGGTVFGLFGSSAQAHQAAHELRALWPGYWVAAAPVI